MRLYSRQERFCTNRFINRYFQYSLHHIRAAAVPLAALTAWQSSFDSAQLQPGQRVLIHAGSGGVGHFAVQLAKWKGAYVFATASTKNQELLRELGADEIQVRPATSNSRFTIRS